MKNPSLKPLLMGILNATPDSFYDKGHFFSLEKAVQRGLCIAQEGADLIDIGGESACPGATPISEEEELRRVIPLIEALASQVSIPLSIDTRKAKVAEKAIEKGARLINDITGFSDPAMQEVAAQCDADLCIMHMQGTPQTMQINPTYPEGVVEHIMRFFEKKIEQLTQRGVKPSRIILDPGIGFGKTVEQNQQLLEGIDQFKTFGLRILIGASRKSFIQKVLGKTAEEILAGTLAIHSYCLFKGADMLRVHDIKEHRDIIDILVSQARIYRNNLKDREFDKEASQNSHLERETIVRAQGTSEDENFEKKPTRSKADSSGCFGII